MAAVNDIAPASQPFNCSSNNLTRPLFTATSCCATKCLPSGTARHHCSQNPTSQPGRQILHLTWDAKSHSPLSQRIRPAPSESPDSHVRISRSESQSQRAQHLISKTSCRCFTAPVSSPALANHSAVEIEGQLRRITSRFGQLLGLGWD